ncbi:MAG: DUF6029 family protein [Myxococcota bacterium]|nr:DUF6029 family protein [Myxococcota bacterium]
MKSISIATCLVVALVQVVGARPASVRLTNTTVTEFRTDNENLDPRDDNYGSVINRLNLNGNSGPIATSLRLDSMFFWDTDQPWHENDARVERLKVQYRLSDWTIKVGDIYRQLGRGIVLNLRKVDEAGLDVLLRGGEVAYSSNRQAAGVFAGRANIVNIDILNQRFVEDPEDILAGGWYALRNLKLGSLRTTLGTHYLYRKNQASSALSEMDDGSSNLGAYIEFPALGDYGSLYLEADIQQTREFDQVTEGKAAYGAVDFFIGDTSLVVEAIYLDQFRQYGSVNRYDEPVRYNQAPTLDRIDQETSKGENEYAARIRLEQSFLDGDFVVYVNGMYKIIDPDDLSEVTQVHGYSGLKGEFDSGRSRYALSGGYRDENATGGPTTRDIKDMYHAEIDYIQFITNGYSLQLAAFYEFRTLEGTSYERGSSFFGIQKAGLGSVTFEHGLDNQDTRDGARQQFYAGILSWNATESMIIKSTVGSQRGGLKCVGGVCRIYPSFSGYQLSVLMNHDLGGM